MTDLAYTEFLDSKRISDPESGFECSVDDINPMLFDFQKAVVKWALKRGRAAIFADCGLGKTALMLEWGQKIHERMGMDILILAPLAVSLQTQREGDKFGIAVNVCRKQVDVKPGINITNYEMLPHFDKDAFGGLVLDESSILKGIYGKLRRSITDFGLDIPYRLACTATPAPNDLFEIINHAEYLGVMTEKEILATFFTQDFTATSHKWKLKGHGSQDFWKWLASWARAFRKPSDLGFNDEKFILPPLNLHHCVVETNPIDQGTLFTLEANTLQEQRDARRKSLPDRLQKAQDLIGDSEEQWLVWCDLNVESELASKSIDGAVEVTGSDTNEHKENAMLGFSVGDVSRLVTKSKIAGHGMNWQSCHNVVFLGISHSFESFYQAVRRCWRFGQTEPVNVHIITADTEGAVLANIQRKEKQADSMFNELLQHMKDYQTMNTAIREEAEYIEDVASGEGWELRLGDSVETIKSIAGESVGLVIYSPPFPGMYAFSNTPRDIGNVKDFQGLLDHYVFLLPELLRILKPGRNCCVHLTQGIAFKHSDGYVGLKDFRGAVIKAHEDAGFIYYGEVCIEKNPQLKALRTKDQGLLFKTLASDAAKSRMAMADYVIQFRKPGDNPEPVMAGKADHLKDKGNKGWITNVEWIKWASPVWYMSSEDNPDGIRESDVLAVSKARDAQDEKHLCALQLSVIERCIKLWSNPGDVVYDPFTGIGSTGFEALRLGRHFKGGELKLSYFNVAVSNLRDAEKLASQDSLF
jgi:DNA modification methylase